MPPWLIALRLLFVVGREVRDSFKSEQQRQREHEEAVVRGVVGTIVFFVFVIPVGMWLFTRSDTDETRSNATPVSAQDRSYQSPMVSPSYPPPREERNVDGQSATTENPIQDAPNQTARQTVGESGKTLMVPPSSEADGPKPQGDSQALSQSLPSETQPPHQARPNAQIFIKQTPSSADLSVSDRNTSEGSPSELTLPPSALRQDSAPPWKCVGSLHAVIAKHGDAAIGDPLFVDADTNGNKLVVQRAKMRGPTGCSVRKTVHLIERSFPRN